MSTNMSNNIVPIGESKNQRPSNSAFKQQKLSAWQPILTAGTVLPTFFLIGVAFIPVGIGLLISSSKVHEYEVDYTSCQRVDPNSHNDTKHILCSEYITAHRDSKEECKCAIEFQLENDIKRDVFIYYGMNNFYQNHRRYVKSRSDYQLLGHLNIGHECDPFGYRLDPEDGELKQIAPCGAIANSFFNDTFVLERRSKEERYRTVPILETGIAWATDKKNKFHNPSLKGSSNLELAFNGTIQPENWPKKVYQLDSDPNNNGFQNERFIVWMRTSAFPTFRKLYARIAHDRKDEDVDYQDGLPKGEYRVTITYNFPVAEFKGKKRFIISNTSWLGGKNHFIGAVYIFVGITALILSAIFLLIHKKFSKNSADNFNITSQTPFIVNS